jgi:ADP-ribose pyrophosphatase YjhB (NUDIX family)
MAVIKRPADGALLVSQDANPAGELFQRPLGGHVEFGEYSEDTVYRELAEEIGQRLTGVDLLGVLENLFEWAGELQHEIVFVYEASFADAAAYDVTEQGILDHPERSTRVIWRPADATSPPLYPDGIAELAELAGDPDAPVSGAT